MSDAFCHGCAHSAAGAEFPGQPSGERPCCFCVRNSKREDPPIVAVWYDGSAPVKIPMDCYHSIDMKEQMGLWSQGTWARGNGTKK
jgi:hypothetical protein